MTREDSLIIKAFGHAVKALCKSNMAGTGTDEMAGTGTNEIVVVDYKRDAHTHLNDMQKCIDEATSPENDEDQR